MEELQYELDEHGPISTLLADIEDDMDEDEREDIADDDKVYVKLFERFENQTKKIIADHNVDFDKDSKMEKHVNQKIEERNRQEKIRKEKAEKEANENSTSDSVSRPNKKRIQPTAISDSSSEPKKRRIQPTSI